MPNVGVVLSGNGVFDGSEIHEATLTLLALDKADATALCMAPNVNQIHVINHITGKPSEGETRNVLVESARIARGNIKDIKEYSAKDMDALIFPGGFGAAKNLCDFAINGPNCSVNEDVVRLVKEMVEAKKPVGFVCIAPVIMSKIYEGSPIKLTIGTDEGTAQAMESLGTNHVSCPVKEIVIDKENKIVSTPAYMLAQRISEVETGVTKLVNEVLKMI